MGIDRGFWNFPMAGRLLMASLLALGTAACERVEKSQSPKTVALAFSYADQIGWLHRSCLAIANANLARGTPVAAVIAGEPQKILRMRVGQQTRSPETCPALMPGRAALNTKPGIFFYELEGDAIGATDMGVGVVAPPAAPEIVGGQVRVDLDHDGRGEVISTCATQESIKFAVWSDKSYQGRPRWSADYHLDYDVTPNCP